MRMMVITVMDDDDALPSKAMIRMRITMMVIGDGQNDDDSDHDGADET